MPNKSSGQPPTRKPRIKIRYREKDHLKIEHHDGMCLARTREGGQCLSTKLLRGGRCRLHGGLSTGPKTLTGKQRSARNIPGKTYEDFLIERKYRRWATTMPIIYRKQIRKVICFYLLKYPQNPHLFMQYIGSLVAFM